MKKVTLIIILILVCVGVVQFEKTRCREDQFTNCKVQKETYESIPTGTSFFDVKKIIGEKNMRPIDSKMIPTCQNSDSGFSWVSHKSNNPYKSAILMGFQNDTMVCKSYILGEPK